ncbi:MAG: hemolysin family protein [Chloroflexota bacterium]
MAALQLAMSDQLALLLRLAAVLLLVALNGFFVAAEFALVSVRRTRIAELADQGSAGAARVQRALGDLDHFIAATQLGITMASLGLGWLGEPAVAQILHAALGWAPLPFEKALIAGVVAFVLITTLHIVFGELAPKSIALQRTERTAILVVPPTAAFLALFRPAIILLNGAGAAVVRLLRLDPAGKLDGGGFHSAQEIELLVEQSARGGTLDEMERQMIRGVFDVGDRNARQVMVPRVQIQGLRLGASLEEAVAGGLAARHSRLPVYDGNLDHIVGMVHLRDLLRALAETPAGSTRFNLGAILRPVPAVPEAVTLDEVLVTLREQRAQLAVVVDEYGGTAGILTLEDILEEIVGELNDEFALPGPAEITARPDGSWLLDGLLPLDEVDEHVGTRLAAAADTQGNPLDVETLAGLITARLGRLAVAGDLVLEPGEPPVCLSVEEVIGRRIARVALRKETGERADPG